MIGSRRLYPNLIGLLLQVAGLGRPDAHHAQRGARYRRIQLLSLLIIYIKCFLECWVSFIIQLTYNKYYTMVLPLIVQSEH